MVERGHLANSQVPHCQAPGWISHVCDG